MTDNADHEPPITDRPGKRPNAGGVDTKRRVRQGLIFALLATAFAVLAGFFVSFDKRFSNLAVGLLWCFLTTAAIGFMEDFRRFQGKRKHAFWGGGALILIGSALCAYLLRWNQIQPQVKVHEWDPPELPEECKTAYFSLDGTTWEISLADIKHGRPFVPPGIPDVLLSNFPTLTLTNNRLYAIVCRSFQGKTTVISNPFIFDDSPCPCDRNYNANAFELINEYGIPVMQVIYERPNRVAINGVMLLTKQGALGGVWAMFGTNSTVAQVSNRDEAMRVALPYKAQVLFKYPSWKHPHELASERN